jgi:hypothetical protein
MDCFAEPVIGPRYARTRWLAMTDQIPAIITYLISTYSSMP